jgi:hypothetical protein
MLMLLLGNKFSCIIILLDSILIALSNLCFANICYNASASFATLLSF